MDTPKRTRIVIPLFSILLVGALCTDGCSTTEQTSNGQSAQANTTVSDLSARTDAGQTEQTEPYSLEDEIADNPSMAYVDGTFTLDGVSVDIPDELTLTDVQDDEVVWSDGTDQRELRISKVQSSASSSDLTQREVVAYLQDPEYCYIKYYGNSVLTCEGNHWYRLLKDTTYDKSEWRNFYTAASQDGSFIKISFICKYNETDGYFGVLPQDSEEWPETIVSKIIDSLQSNNEVTHLYDIPKEEGASVPLIATSELTCTYDAYWKDGKYNVEVQIDSPSFLGYEGDVTVTCRDYHDKIMATQTQHVYCVGLTSNGRVAEACCSSNDRTLEGSPFVFSEDRVWTTPEKIEVTIE